MSGPTCSYGNRYVQHPGGLGKHVLFHVDFMAIYFLCRFKSLSTIYIIIVFAVMVQSYITSLHPGLSRAKSNGTRRYSAVRRLSSPRSPDVVLGERVLRMLISCPECHRIPLTRSVFMFETIEDTPNIIRTGCTVRLFQSRKSSSMFDEWLCLI